MKKQPKDQDKEEAKAAQEHESVSISDMSYETNLAPLEHKAIIYMIERFSLNFSEQLSGFTGKKIDIAFEQLNYIQNVLNQNNHHILSSFSIAEQAESGLIVYENQLLDLFIDALFGYNNSEERSGPIYLGKCSLKIAKEIASKCLNSLQQGMPAYIEFNSQLMRTSSHLKDFFYQQTTDKIYEFRFNLSINAKKTLSGFSIRLPERFIEHIIFYEQALDEQSEKQQLNAINEQIKNDVIETSVQVVAAFPEIKFKINDILNLKSGDLIPIPNPNEVVLKVGSKQLCKAVVGQANSFKVVKTKESIKDC